MGFVRAGILILFYAILPVCIGLLLAALLSRVRIRGVGTYRVLLFLPQTIADGGHRHRVALDLLRGRHRQRDAPGDRPGRPGALVAG